MFGTGSSEYVRVADSSLRLFGAVAIVAFLFQIDLARGFLLISLPLGILVLLTVRWLWRQWLIAQRSVGEYAARVLLVGSVDSVANIARELARTPSAGYRVVGACTPTGRVGAVVPGTDIPMMGNVNAVDRAMERASADTVAVTSTDELPPTKVKEISWGLQAGRQHLVLAPSIVDIAGPRLHTRPVAGLPLIHVETPRFSKGQLFLKRTVDIFASTIGVVLLSPVLAFLAMSIRLSSEGPVLFRQTRIGRGGREFTMLKFRSMVTNAEELLENLQRQRREARDTQTVERAGALAADEHFTDAEQHGRHVRERREVARCADRALHRNHRQHVGVEQRDQRVHHFAADAGVAAAKA